MHFGKYYLLLLTLIMGILGNAHAVPPVLNYAGQVAINGEAFDGNGLFKFALVNADGTTTYWSNDGTSVDGSEPQASVAVVVNGGLYSILLGNTAQQGMGAIDPALFAQHNDAKLRVWFSDGVNGFQQLSPDRSFASVPYAFNSESAKSADSANVATTAMAVQAGAITKQMLGQDVLSDLNRTVNHNDLSPQIKADINATIGMNRLSSEVTEKLNQEKTTTNYNAPSVGSLLAVPYGSDAPAGYSLYQRGTPKELVWEEKAPVSVARNAYDGVEVLDGKIYFVGGYNGSAKNIAERYDPSTNTWETLNSMTQSRNGGAYSVLNSKLYAIAGANSTSVEIFDYFTGNWTNSANLAEKNNFGTAITTNGKIYLIGGSNGSGIINKVLSFDPTSNEWSAKTNMPTARASHKLVWFENRIWAIGGNVGSPSNKVESYDPYTDLWQTETSLTFQRLSPVAWVANGRIYVGGGKIDASQYLKSIEVYDPTSKQWTNAGNFPEIKSNADAVVLNDVVYVVAGYNGSAYFNKVYAADLNASMEGVYDLYRKDGDAPAGTPVVQSEYADGSVTASKMAEGAVSKSALDATILKYLKPEITAQPQASTIYAGGDGTVSFSAEGKYLTYQWKKDGLDLTGETNATLTITDANATQHDGNYSVLVSNDFGSEESNKVELKISDALLNGLVGWWKFDETSGTVAYDSSGNGNDGNLINGPTWTNGKIGGALSFDGVDDFVQTSVASNSLPISISTWIYAHDISGSHSIIDSDATGQYGHSLIIGYSPKNGNYQIEFHDGSVDTSHPATLNQWTHAVVQFDSKISFFADGAVKLEQAYQKGNLNGTNFRMGRHGSNTNLFKGLIDDVRIYDRALSAEEVHALYNLGQ